MIKPFTIKVVHTKRSTAQAYTVYVGRPTALGNPFSNLQRSNAKFVPTLEEVINKYSEWLSTSIENSEEVCNALNHLLTIGQQYGKLELACWCKDENKPYPSDHACHADVIRDVIYKHIQENNND